VRGGFAATADRDFDARAAADFLFSVASARPGSKRSSLDEASSCLARIEARLDAR